MRACTYRPCAVGSADLDTDETRSVTIAAIVGFGIGYYWNARRTKTTAARSHSDKMR